MWLVFFLGSLLMVLEPCPSWKCGPTREDACARKGGGLW